MRHDEVVEARVPESPRARSTRHEHQIHEDGIRAGELPGQLVQPEVAPHQTPAVGVRSLALVHSLDARGAKRWCRRRVVAV